MSVVSSSSPAAHCGIKRQGFDRRSCYDTATQPIVLQWITAHPQTGTVRASLKLQLQSISGSAQPGSSHAPQRRRQTAMTPGGMRRRRHAPPGSTLLLRLALAAAGLAVTAAQSCSISFTTTLHDFNKVRGAQPGPGVSPKTPRRLLDELRTVASNLAPRLPLEGW